MSERLWLSVREASEMTTLSPGYIRAHAPVRREGRRVLVPLSWVVSGAQDGGHGTLAVVATHRDTGAEQPGYSSPGRRAVAA